MSNKKKLEPKKLRWSQTPEGRARLSKIQKAKWAARQAGQPPPSTNLVSVPYSLIRILACRDSCEFNFNDVRELALAMLKSL